VLAEQEDAVYQLVTMVAKGYLGLPLSPEASAAPGRSEEVAR
jgi:hypothetical protein